MKRKILLITFITLLVIPFIFVGCIGQNKASDTTTPTTLEGVAARVSTLESGAVNYALKSELNAYVATGDVYTKSEMDTLFDSLLDDLDDITAPNLSGYVLQATYDALAVRVTALEGSGGGGTTPPVTGEVTVVIDTNYTIVQTGSSGSAVGAIPVEIINSTDEYQFVTFGLQVTCDGSLPAELLTAPEFSVSESFGGTGCDMTGLPIAGSYRYFSAYWDVATCGEGFFIAPNGTKMVYIHLDIFKTTETEIWTFSIVGIWHSEYS